MRHVLALALIALSSPAMAVDWLVDPEASTMTFGFSQMGQQVEGRFEKFEASVSFDSAALDQAAITSTIDIASVSTGNAQVDTGVQSAGWFYVASHPTASFVSHSVVSAGGDLYDIEGDLTIKGTSLPVTLRAEIVIDGSRATANATTTIDRRDFGIGIGEWAANPAVGFEIPITLAVTAARAN